MRLTYGLLRISLAKTYPHGKSLWFQRHVPKDLLSRYPTKVLKHNLRTLDPVKAARLADALDRRYTAEFEALRAAPETSPEALDIHADAFLRRWGLQPLADGNHPEAIRLLHDYFDSKRGQFAQGDDATYRRAHPDDYLSPVESRAWNRLHVAPRDTISDALAVYLEGHKKSGREAWEVNTRRTVNALVKVTGNKAMVDFDREDARRYLTTTLAAGKKTSTVRRHLNVFGAVWGFYERERMRGLPNPFERLQIPGEGEDSEVRGSYEATQLEALYRACRELDDDRRWLFALMMDTGARLAEMAGLATADLKVDAAIPHVVIQAHPWRSLKNRNSAREVPLVGASLWAAQRILATSIEGQRFAFPRYTNEVRCSNASASATLLKWVRSLGIDGLNHELRHTMYDRLREVQCPKEMAEVISGHRKDMSDGYGRGHSLQAKQEWLQKVALSIPLRPKTK